MTGAIGALSICLRGIDTKYYKNKRTSPYVELQARLHKFYKRFQGLYNNDDVYKDNVTI